MKRWRCGDGGLAVAGSNKGVLALGLFVSIVYLLHGRAALLHPASLSCSFQKSGPYVWGVKIDNIFEFCQEHKLAQEKEGLRWQPSARGS